MDNGALYQIFEDRRRELGLSQNQVGELATGSAQTSAIQNIRRGSSPSIARVAALCEALGLELYVGPKRPTDTPRVSPSEVRIGGEEYSLVRRYDVNVSAGPGLIPSSEDAGGRLAFSQAWLARQHVHADHAGLVRVRGDSMAPTIPDGALVLVHSAEMEVDREGIYAFSRDGAASVKRLVPVDRGPDGRPTSMVIISDNAEYPPEVVTGARLNDLRIVGRIRCIMVDL